MELPECIYSTYIWSWTENPVWKIFPSVFDWKCFFTCVWCWLAASWLLLLPRVYVHISTDQIRHLVLLLNSSSSRLDYYTSRAWQDFRMSLAITGQPRWCDTPPRVHSERPAQQDKNLILTISNVRQKFWFHKIISKKKTIFIENLFWTDVFYL
jgi:hypothetical protein